VAKSKPQTEDQKFCCGLLTLSLCRASPRYIQNHTVLYVRENKYGNRDKMIKCHHKTLVAWAT